MTLYLNSEDYNALVEALLTGSADPMDRKNAIRITLADRADVWPAAIKDAVEDDVIELDGDNATSSAMEALLKLHRQ